MTTMTQDYDKLVSKYMREEIAIIIIKSVSKAHLNLYLRLGPSLQAKHQTASRVLFSALNAIKKQIAAALTIAGLTLPSAAFAQTQDTDIRPNANQLSGENIRAIFSGATMDGAYNFGRNGLAESFYTEEHRADGTLTYKEAGEIEPGRWFVRKDALCYMYPSNQLAGGCFRVYQIKNCYYFYSALRRQADYELGEDYWTARSVKMGERAACDPAMS